MEDLHALQTFAATLGIPSNDVGVIEACMETWSKEGHPGQPVDAAFVARILHHERRAGCIAQPASAHDLAFADLPLFGRACILLAADAAGVHTYDVPGIAIVTGASTGIGKATAEALALAGYCVFGTSRNVKGLGPAAAEMVACEITDQASVDHLVAHVMAAAGRIDLVVNNAGMGLVGAAEESSSEQVKALFDVNLFGAMRLTNAVLPSMRARRSGRIINMSSALGLVPAP